MLILSYQVAQVCTGKGRAKAKVVDAEAEEGKGREEPRGCRTVLSTRAKSLGMRPLASPLTIKPTKAYVWIRPRAIQALHYSRKVVVVFAKGMFLVFLGWEH